MPIIQEEFVVSYDGKVLGVASSAPVPVAAPTWRCFHCCFETKDHDEAKAHFGDDSDDPALCVFWASMDDAERAHEYQQMVLELNATRDEVRSLHAAIENESADGMQLFRELESRMHQDIRRAEEDGYARGLRDAQKHPEELGLCRLKRFYIGGLDNPYMIRWYVIPRNRWFNIYLHKFCRDDDDRAFHDHPWWFISFMLHGGYIEHRTGMVAKIRRAFSVAFRRATTQHRIELFRDNEGAVIPCWTLVITGRKQRTWGFWCPKGFVPWHDFVDHTDEGNTGKGCGEYA